MSVKLIKALDVVRRLPNITLGNILIHVENEALLVLCLVAILPFLQPIPIPGLSSVLGFIVVLQGIALMRGGKPILTEKLKKINIAHEKFEKIYSAAQKISSFTSKISLLKNPVVNSRICHFFCGLLIIISALFLSLPLPIPFSNLVPALSIFLVCVGLLEEDILLVLSGGLVTLGVFWIALESVHLIKTWFENWL